MSLPDLARLASAPKKTLRDLGRALAAIGVRLSAAAPIVAAVEGLPPVLRRPIRAFHLRRRRDAVGVAMRALLFSDPVTPEEARSAFRDALAPMLDLGLLAAQPDGSVVSPFVLAIADDLFVLSDDLAQGGEAVMGLGSSTIDLCRAAFPVARVGRVLDMGCGSGTAALVLARQAREAIGVDLNPRAVALARVNAALNGLENVSFREGDLFASVVGETFDLIVSQPPFVPRPRGAAAATYLYGGARGDELALTLLARVGAHLAPGGRAILGVDWPEGAGDPLEARLRRAVGDDGPSLIVLASPTVSPDEHATSYAAGLHPALGPAFDDEVAVRLAHFVDQGLTGVRPTIVVIEPARAGEAFTELVPIEARSRGEIGSGRIDRLLAARALLARGDDAIGAARLRVPEGTVLAQEQEGPGAEVASTLVARLPPAALVGPRAITGEELLLVTTVHEGASVREGIARFCEQTGADLEVARAHLLALVRGAIAAGLLEVA